MDILDSKLLCEECCHISLRHSLEKCLEFTGQGNFFSGGHIMHIWHLSQDYSQILGNKLLSIISIEI